MVDNEIIFIKVTDLIPCLEVGEATMDTYVSSL